MTERRISAKLNQLVANRQLSSESLDWLMCALDPFHDTEQSCAGYPDISSSKSIVQTITKTANFTVPSGAGGGPWDAHVFLLPCSTVFSTTSNTNSLYRYLSNPFGTLTATGQPPMLFPGVNVVSGITGAPWSATGNTSSNALQLDQTFCSGQYRLIGVGWEISDTSPVVFKQGSLTAYRAPNTRISSYLQDSTGTRYPATYSTLPPATQTTAVLYPNSRTWQASEGCYQIGTLNDAENQYVNPVPGIPVFKYPQALTDIAAGNPTLTYTSATDDATTFPTAQPVLFGAVRANATVLPWDISGAILVGLNNQGSFQVTARYYVEKVPTLSDPNLLVLAKTPTPYDPLAIELYARATQELPVAVPVGENPLGEWFEKVLDAVASALPVVGAALNTVIPGASLVGQGLSAGAKALSGWNKAERMKQDVPQVAQLAKTTTVALSSNGNAVSTTGRKRPKPLPKRPKPAVNKKQ